MNDIDRIVPNMKPRPLAAFLDESGLRVNPARLPDLQRAELVVGEDVMSTHQFIVYGREVLREIVRTGQLRPVAVLLIGVDQATNELEQLLALMVAYKGRHDYESYTEAQERLRRQREGA